MSAGAVYVRRGANLALYHRKASLAFWDEQWHRLTDKELRHVLRPTGSMPLNLGRFFSHQLPRGGLILEAGCGTGLMVRRLCIRGYDCIGLDYAVLSLMRSKTVCPELPLVGGNILRLPFRDGSLAGLVSLGVVEHFEDGPGAALGEISRVLGLGGIACISVPFESPLRQAAPTTSEHEATTQGLEFYQYYFTRSSFETELEEAGLQPTGAFCGYAVFTVVKDRLRWLGKLVRFLPHPKFYSFLLDLVPGLPGLAAHMMLVAAVKV